MHVSANWKTQIRICLLKNHEEQRKTYF